MSTYTDFKLKCQKIADLSFSSAVLEWDQQTYMPKNGARFRAQQVSTLRTLAHEFSVSAEYGDMVKKLMDDTSLSEEERINVRLAYRDYNKKKKYPIEFVEEFTRLCGDAFTAWDEAKKTNNFSVFEPFLTKLVSMKKVEAEFLGYKSHPYEALMDDYEPELTVQKMDEVFADVKNQLFPFLKKILEKNKPSSKILHQHFPKDQQRAVVDVMVKEMGYDFNSGRADYTSHPFSTTFAPGDSRITLWSDESFISPMLYAGIHEAGHALYEMGIPLEKHYGLPLGQALSMAFHESQSRFWENNVGRSLQYCRANFPKLQKQFSDQFKNVTADDFYAAVNEVAPTLIRVEADELTYHAHIYIRYTIEKALMKNEIQVKDIPSYWNEKYKEYLGITPPSDTKGCLQDVHWSYGSFGYFPTYSLGSFYAAQLAAQMKKDIPGFDQKIESGETSHALKWLRENVHVHGRRYTSAELLTRVTGSDLKFSYFMDYVREKYGKLYNI